MKNLEKLPPGVRTSIVILILNWLISLAVFPMATIGITLSIIFVIVMSRILVYLLIKE